MNPWIKKICRELGKTEQEVTEVWKTYKQNLVTSLNKQYVNFEKKEIQKLSTMVMDHFIEREIIIRPKDFLDSKKSAKDFINEVMVSSNFAIDNTIIPPDEENDSDIEEEDILSIVPDGTGPHGRGMGPGKGKADGSGMYALDDENEEEEEDDEIEQADDFDDTSDYMYDESSDASFTIEELAQLERDNLVTEQEAQELKKLVE
jgi:hypothetical protein